MGNVKKSKHIKRNTIFKTALIFISLALGAILLLIVLETKNIIDLKKAAQQTTPQDTSNNQNTNTVDYGPPKAEDSIISPEKSDTSKSNEQNTNTLGDISVLITRANRNSVGVFIEKISDGECVLTVTQSGIEKIKIESAVVQERDYSTCQGFDLDESKLDTSPFIINVKVTSNERSGVATQEVK